MSLSDQDVHNAKLQRLDNLEGLYQASSGYYNFRYANPQQQREKWYAEMQGDDLLRDMDGLVEGADSGCKILSLVSEMF